MKQSEIWLVDLNPTIGAEMNKLRPALIISDNSVGILPLKIIVPLTDWKERYRNVLWMIEVKSNLKTGLKKQSAIDCLQIRCVSKERLIRKIGDIDELTFSSIQRAVQSLISVDID